MLLRWFQKTGNKPIVADGRRHDPDRRPIGQRRIPSAAVGRADRPQHGRDPFRSSPNSCKFGQRQTDADMVNNADWLDELRYIPLLRDVGRAISRSTAC